MTTHFARFFVTPVLCITLLAACGGGGGGGGTSSSVTYTGVATEAIAHPVMRRQLRTLRVRLVEGGVLRSLIDDVETLPLATRRLLMAAERAGDLETAFDTLADDLADEAERRSTRLLSVLQPALIVAMFVIIGSILMAVMLPLLTLPSKVI